MKSTTEGVGAAKPLGATPPFPVVLYFHVFRFVLYLLEETDVSLLPRCSLLSFFVIVTLPLAIMIVLMSVQDWVKCKISRVI